MATARITLERYQHRPRAALSIVDRLRQALRASGRFPPPLGDIECAIVAATAPVARRYEPARLLTLLRTRAGYFTFDGSYTNPEDPGRQWTLAPGSYEVRVRSPLYLDETFELTWPPAPDRRVRIPKAAADVANLDSLELRPSAAYPLPDLTLGSSQLGPTLIRGTALAADGTPIEGITAEVLHLPLLQPAGLPALGNWPFLQTLTSASGDWALLLPSRRYLDARPDELPAGTPPIALPINVSVAYTAGAVTTRRTVLLGAEHSVRNTGLRGHVLGPGGSPIAGARISTDAGAAVTTTRADGSWFLYFGLDQPAVVNLRVTATTPWQATATEPQASVQPGAIVVVPTFHFA